MGDPTAPRRPIQVSIYSRGAAKPVLWVGRALDRVRDLPAEARQEVGRQLQRVQRGLDPSDSKPMPSVGPGVVEIRIHAGGEYRVLFVARFAEGIYVLHAFEKRTRRTRRRDIEQAKINLAEVLRHRAR